MKSAAALTLCMCLVAGQSAAASLRIDPSYEAPEGCVWGHQEEKEAVDFAFACREPDGVLALVEPPPGFDQNTLPLAGTGDDAAMVSLALFYLTGPDHLRNEARAIELIRTAAATGDGMGTLFLADFLSSGGASQADLGEALRLYRLSAEVGSSEAMLKIARAYWNGDGVPVDNVEAVRWFERAAIRGNSAAVQALAFLYVFGREGVPSDPVRARRWECRSEEVAIPAQNAVYTMEAIKHGWPTWLSNVEVAHSEIRLGRPILPLPDLSHCDAPIVH